MQILHLEHFRYQSCNGPNSQRENSNLTIILQSFLILNWEIFGSASYPERSRILSVWKFAVGEYWSTRNSSDLFLQTSKQDSPVLWWGQIVCMDLEKSRKTSQVHYGRVIQSVALSNGAKRKMIFHCSPAIQAEAVDPCLDLFKPTFKKAFLLYRLSGHTDNKFL